MRIGPFIELSADTFGVDRKSVTVIARTLREAGFLSTGARGVNAPHMTPQDAARLALALMTGEPPSTVVGEFEFYRGLTLRDNKEGLAGFLEISGLGPGHTIEEMLTFLFGVFATPEKLDAYAIDLGDPKTLYDPPFSIRLHEITRNISLRLKGSEYIYSDNEAMRRLRDLHVRQRTASDRKNYGEALSLLEEIGQITSRIVGRRGMRVTREISGVEVAQIGLAIAGHNPAGEGRTEVVD